MSTIDEFTKGGFREVIDDDLVKPAEVTKLVLCSGKLYYDLLAEREEIKKNTTALVRIEQLFPFPKTQLMKLKEKYKNVRTYIWAQEEPANMGAWEFIRNKLEGDINIKVIARPPSGSTATGSSKFHAIRQRKIIDKVFEECECPFIGEECNMACIGNKWKSFDEELKELQVENIDSKFHSGTKPLK
jgi:2-oxoglutarate dehydrogenase E1 component